MVSQDVQIAVHGCPDVVSDPASNAKRDCGENVLEGHALWDI